MIQLKSIKREILQNSEKVIIKVIIKKKIYTFFYKIKKGNVIYDYTNNVDFLIPIFFNIGYYLGLDIDLNGFSISRELFKNLKKIEKLYNHWYHNNKNIHLKNYHLQTNHPQQKEINNAIFFSLGVDSFYTLYKTQIHNLIFIHGFDIKQTDRTLFRGVKHSLEKFCNKNNFNGVIIETNLRDFTENFCNRNQMFGSGFASIGLLLHQYNQYYISSWMDDKIGYPRGSHKDLDYLRGNGETQFIHFGAGIPRSEKIKFISHYDDIYEYLRVCRKNYHNKYNCGICEKCIRTMLDFNNIHALHKFHTLPKKLDISLIDTIEITDANFSYYDYLIKTGNLEPKYLSIITKKVHEYIPNKQWEKKKNIIFIDFNGVISYKNFWFSLEKDNPTLYESINTFLFRDNKQIIQDWMLGKYQSDEICQFIADHLDVDAIFLYQTFVKDCINLDLSLGIQSLLAKLKKYYHIVLVTDNMDSFSQFTLKNHKDFFSVFDAIFNSAEKGYFKNEAYGKYIQSYDATIMLSYLIDDSIGNCQKFTELGGQSIHTKGEDQVIKVLDKILKEAERKREWQI